MIPKFPIYFFAYFFLRGKVYMGNIFCINSRRTCSICDRTNEKNKDVNLEKTYYTQRLQNPKNIKQNRRENLIVRY